MYWSLNTFFPTIQFFFESGLSCTIDGSHLPGAIVGLDPILRFRLTDCTHEEEGRVIKGTLSEKFAKSSANITILEVATARRTSSRVRSEAPAGGLLKSNTRVLDIIQETHTVIGVRLNGMSEMGYVWAKIETPKRAAAGRIWGDVSVVGLRNDIPAPVLGLSAVLPEAGSEVKVVEKNSMIRLPGGVDRSGRPWI